MSEVMPVISTSNRAAVGIDGLHLYHSGVSNCSMRVRITLEEKGLAWESHHFDILAKEHLTPDYFAINPKGLVPTLVHDGAVVTESDDIIDYLDQSFPNPPLRPSSATELEKMYNWLHRATAMHVKAVKTHIYEKRVGSSMRQNPEEQSQYQALQSDPELLEFHNKTTTGAFTADELAQAKATLDASFADLEQALDGQEWIAGDSFSLADIAWMPLYFTLGELAGYSFADRPNVQAWADRIARRASFKSGVMDWWPF